MGVSLGDRGPDATVTRVVVVEKHGFVRRGIEAILHGLPHWSLLASADSMSKVIQYLTADPPPQILVASSDLDDADFSILVNANIVGLIILVLVRDRDPEHYRAASRFQPDGFLMEDDISPSSLDSALSAVLKGGVPLPPAMAKFLIAAGVQARQGVGGANLTARELQVLQLLAAGRSNKEAARSLSLSEFSIKRYVSAILAKLDSPNRTLAVARALKEGLIKN